MPRPAAEQEILRALLGKGNDAEIHDGVIRHAPLLEPQPEQKAPRALEHERDKGGGNAVEHQRDEQRRRLLFQLVGPVDVDEQEDGRQHRRGNEDRVGIEQEHGAASVFLFRILNHKTGRMSMRRYLLRRPGHDILIIQKASAGRYARAGYGSDAPYAVGAGREHAG